MTTSAAGGGSEHLLHNILAAIPAKCLGPPVGCQGPVRPMSPFITDQIRKQFTNLAIRGKWGPPLYSDLDEQENTFTMRLAEDGEVVSCTFNKDEITRAWNDAHKAPFELMEKLLQKLKKKTTEPISGTLYEPVIIIAGGSTKNDPFKRKASEMIRKANLPMETTIFLDDH